MPLCHNCGQDNPNIARFCLACAHPLQRASHPVEVRKTVTILFSDLAGSTALGERLDPEALREVMTAYFARMRGALERHGGAVEKYIGDAVMAVFGLPSAHEDDALRAARAASDMKDALRELNGDLRTRYGVVLANRTGVYTGEVVAGDVADGQRLATGDAVNTAARLEQAASPGEILLGEPTYRLVKDAVVAESVDSVAAKGKTEPVPAYRLVHVLKRSEAFVRRMDVPLVGRKQELQTLLEALEDAISGQSTRLVTVLGDPGVGKTRLITELVLQADSRATVLWGRCLSYGEGITYWSLAEMLRKRAGIADRDSVEEARDKLGVLMSGVDETEVLVERLASVMGLSEAAFPAPETAWAARTCFEHMADHKPLVLVFDDIHWAEQTLLDLIEHVARLGRAPMLLLCGARHDLLEDRPRWDAEVEGARTLVLRPLEDDSAVALAESRLGQSELPEALAERISSSAQGNPLFIEQMLAAWINDGILAPAGDGWSLAADAAALAVPRTISALLAARVDRLLSAERVVIERASVVGQSFTRAAVEALSPEADRLEVPVCLLELTRKNLLGRESATAADDAYRFRHALIRDAVYVGILKRTRAELHEQFGTWLEEVSGERLPEVEEIVAYHLEQAYLLLGELGPVDERSHDLGRRAAMRLSAAGRRALARGDVRAASNLLERGLGLLPRDAPERGNASLDLALALRESAELQRADLVLAQLIDEVAQASDRRLELMARLERAFLRLWTDPESSTKELEQLAEETIPELEVSGEEAALARAWHILGRAMVVHGRNEKAYEAFEHAIRHALRAGAVLDAMESMGWQAGCVMVGPWAVREGIRRFHEILGKQGGTRIIQAHVQIYLGVLRALEGDFDEARRRLAEGRSIYADLGWTIAIAAISPWVALIERLDGRLAEAEDLLRTGFEVLEQAGETGFLSTVASNLAEVVYLRDELDEAERLTHVSEDAASPDDAISQIGWRGVRAKVAARRGRVTEGEALAREAVAIAERTDYVLLHGDALMDLATVQRLAGLDEEATDAVRAALDLYERKGNLVSARKAKSTLAELTG